MDFFTFLNDHRGIPIWIIGIIAFLCSLVALYKNLSTIREMCKKFISFIKNIANCHKSRKRRKYNKTISSEKYLKWQNELLDEIYNPIILEYNTKKDINAPTCERAVCFPNSNNAYQFEAVYFKVDERMYSYPFYGISDKNKLIKCEISEKKLSHKKYVK